MKVVLLGIIFLLFFGGLFAIWHYQFNQSNETPFDVSNLFPEEEYNEQQSIETLPPTPSPSPTTEEGETVLHYGDTIFLKNKTTTGEKNYLQIKPYSNMAISDCAHTTHTATLGNKYNVSFFNIIDPLNKENTGPVLNNSIVYLTSNDIFHITLCSDKFIDAGCMASKNVEGGIMMEEEESLEQFLWKITLKNDTSSDSTITDKSVVRLCSEYDPKDCLGYCDYGELNYPNTVVKEGGDDWEIEIHQFYL